MPDNHDIAFRQQRNEAFDTIIALIEKRIKAAPPALLLRFDEISMESLQQGAAVQSWSLLLDGVRHLKEGAPDHQPGSMTEALSRMSLRSSTFAAALGVKPPQFEQIYFSVEYTTGFEAAVFLCQKAIEAAEGDMPKSRQIMHRKIMTEKPVSAFGSAASPEEITTIKKQMALSFNVLVEAYGVACSDFKMALSALTKSQ